MYGLNEIEGDSGEIVSPLFPSMYFMSSEHALSKYRIVVEDNAKIHIVFSVFEVEDNGFGSHDCLSTLLVSLTILDISRCIEMYRIRYMMVVMSLLHNC